MGGTRADSLESKLGETPWCLHYRRTGSVNLLVVLYLLSDYWAALCEYCGSVPAGGGECGSRPKFGF